MSRTWEVCSFLLYWICDLIRETVYVIFRCRPRKEIKGENILLTGTGQGLGRLVVDRLAKDGNTLHCVDIDAALNKRMKDELLAQERDCAIYTYSCDVGEAENIADLGQKIQANTPDRHISYLFNIAGIVIGKPFEDESEREMLKVMKVNVMGPLYLTKLVLPGMREAGAGHIVNISSLAGIVAGSNMASYVASKFAIRGHTQALQAELDLKGDVGVKLTSVHPHITKTGLFNNVSAKWPLLFPLLEPEWVADQIILAAREERQMVCLPRTINPFWAAEPLMSAHVWRRYSDMLGAHLMEKFVKIRPE